MSTSIEDLKPCNPIVTLGDKELEVSLVTLHHEVYFIEQYGGVGKINSVIQKEPLKILDIMWALINNKHVFNYSKEKFESVIWKSNSMTEWPKMLMDALDTSINKSIPRIKNKKRRDEINKIKQAEDNKEGGPCYADYYDTIASRYGYDLETFYSLTLRQLHTLLQIIGDNKYQELEIEAALNGRELKQKIDYDENITEDEEQKQDKEAEEALKRLQKEYNEKNKGE